MTTSAQFIKKHEEFKAVSRASWRAKQPQRQEGEDREKELILALLARHGIKPADVHTNGYWFNFDYMGMRVRLINQSDRVVGRFWRVPRNEDESEFLEHVDMVAHECESNGTLAEFKGEFLYDEFLFNGDLTETVAEVLALAKHRIDKGAS